MLKGVESGNAVAAALARLVADGFVLRFLAESLLWRFDEKTLAQTEFLRQLKMFLDDLIPATAGRLRALGGCAPQSLAEIQELSSVHVEPNPDAASASLLHLAGEIGSMLNVCRMVAAIARKDDDKPTENLLRETIRSLEGMSRRVNQSAPLP